MIKSSRELPPACAGCPLATKHHPAEWKFVGSSGPIATARVMVIMERPGALEGEEGVPAIGPSGDVLDNGLGGKAQRERTYVTNVRKCCPSGDETEPERKASIVHCTAAYLHGEIAAAKEARAVLLVGADALEVGIGLRAYTWADEHGRKIHEPGIMQYHGSVFTAEEANGIREILTGEGGWRLPEKAHTVVVTLHPAFGLRGQPRVKVEILANIARAVAAANSAPPKPRAQRQRVVINPGEDTNVTFSPNSGPVVLDIETPDDQPEKIEICGISPSPNRAYSFDWKEEYRDRVARLMKSENVLKVGHNLSYDAGAFLANGMPVAYPVADTIIAAARIWPPVAQKKLNEAAAKDKIPIKWLSLDRVALRLLPDVAYWKRPETKATQAFYQVAFPDVKRWEYRHLYNGLDCIYTHRVWRAERELLERLKLLDRFQKVDMPAFLPMVNMERRGLLVDEGRRALLQQDAALVKEEAEREIGEIAERFHQKRGEKIAEALIELEMQLAHLLRNAPGCCGPSPLEMYQGLTKRTKKECCKTTYEAATGLRAKVKDLKARHKKGLDLMKRIGPHFDPAKPDHWRWLLFDPDGLNSERPKEKWIRPVARTKKMDLPQIDDKAMERLQRKHPDVTLFRLKVEATYATWRLNNTLAVETDADGYAHTRLSIHRTSTARYSSGTDREDSEKVRYAAAGNQQNIPDQDRSIYIAPPGYKLLAPDYSQIEARVTAWRAKEYRLLDAWRRGEDIHTNNAVILAAAIGVKLDPADARRLPFPFDPQRKSYRDNGKILTHAWDYGMGPNKTARDFGVPLEIAQKMHSGYFEAYPKLAERIRQVEWEAAERRTLRNAFGLMLGPYDKRRQGGEWVLADREEALAAQPQSDVGDMMKIVSVRLDELRLEPHTDSSSLRTTMHDNFWFYVREDQVLHTAHAIRGVMERYWPELGLLPEPYVMFQCPVEISIGDNGGKRHVHDADCEARGCDSPENPNGLVKMNLPREEAA